jgi:deoxyhypusine synthase
MGNWYRRASRQSDIGFFQIGGGIAGDGPICVVPYLLTDMKEEDTPFWAMFAQITDAHVSYGGYSGASPTEKISWLKLDKDAPTFDIHSDASICFPLVAYYVLGD